MSARDLLGPDGPLAQALAGYETREGQRDMAAAVERVLDEDRILLCEAGTGTGKTLAYLVPALRSGRRVLIATASRALQEQIALVDLPLAKSCLGLDTPSLMMKGLANYLCRRRFGELRERQPAHDDVRVALPVVERWAARTRAGDVAELAQLREGHPILREITSSSDTRIGARCSEYEACHVTAMKRAAESAQLLIVNHHLFLADLAIRGDHPGRVLPPYDAVIIDEAHRLEDVATNFFGVQLSSARVGRLLRDVGRAMKRELELSEEPPIVERARTLSQALLSAVNLAAGSGGERVPITPEWWQGGLLDAYHTLDDALAGLGAELEGQQRGESLALAARRVAELRDALSRVVEPEASTLTWLDRSGQALRISASPVDVGPILRERLFCSGHPVVLTSASLAMGGSFSFIRSRMGLDEPLDAPIDELVVDSAIDHGAQSLLYAPRDLPHVDEPRFASSAAARIAELVAMTPGGTFVLCTSVRSMDALTRALTAALGGAPMKQGDAPKAALLSRFRAHGAAVLVATMSFWEGVDVPGDALRLVVIDRLPFAVPTDPLMVARSEALERRGLSPFARLSLPRAAITLKQGFGRLLRNRRDDGVVAILDRRLSTKSYGATLRESLPAVRCTGALDDVAAFWDQPRHW